ncbi:hypothetical protein [Bradyrhizobium sp. USDA 4486]
MDAALDDVFIDAISFPAADGYALAGTLFLPRTTAPRASAISASFRPDHRDTLWRGVAEWIQGQ